MHNTIKSKTYKLLILIAFSFTLTGCWAINDNLQAQKTEKTTMDFKGKEKNILIEAGVEGNGLITQGQEGAMVFGRVVFVTEDGTRIVLSSHIWQSSYAEHEKEQTLEWVLGITKSMFQKELDTKTSHEIQVLIQDVINEYADNQSARKGLDENEFEALVQSLYSDFLNDVVAGQDTGTTSSWSM